MFFTLSKVLWVVAEPGNLLVILLSLGVVCLAFRWRRLGRLLIGTAILAALVIATAPIGQNLLLTLEDRFPQPRPLPAKIDGIIALGGFTDQFVTKARGQVSFSGAVERLIELAALSRRYPEAKLVISGGSGDLYRQDVKEAEVLGPALEAMGVDRARVVLESNSRNTWENATMTRDLLQPKPGENWILITSAFHMPRSVGCFRKAGWTVIPYPVDYNLEGTRSVRWGFNFTGGLNSLSLGLHEWIGLITYRLWRRTDAMFPAPAPAIR
ncbi:MAG: YdcF family protein [Rhodospirillales bacterium]